jgi:hypothetical protein
MGRSTDGAVRRSGYLGIMTVKELIQQSSVSVMESDFAHDRETIAELRRRTHPPKPATRKLRRRKSSA